MQHEMDAFLQALFAGVEDAYFHLWKLQTKTSHWYSATNLDDYFAETATGSLGDEDIYVGAGLLAAPKRTDQRTTAAEVIGLPALWADIDYQDKLHKKSNLPRDMEHALEVVDSFPLKPTIIVQSGHGIQCWWLFEEPWLFETAEEHHNAAKLTKRWHETLKAIAKQHDCAMDSTFDLSRLMRVPGTFNCKDQQHPRPVVVYSQNTTRYNPSEFEEYLVDEASIADAVQITLNTPVDMSMQPPFDKFMALYENNLNFRQYYEHKKPPANDDSMSGYDLCLANIAVNANWSDEEIVALLVKHRLKWGGEVKHKQYYERTVGTARTRTRFESAPAPQAHATEEAPTADHVRDREAVIEIISNNLGTPVHRFIKYEASPPRYRLILKDGREISLGGAEVLVNQARFQTKMIELANFMPQKMKQADWTLTVNMLQSIVEIESMGDSMSEQGKVREYLHNYLTQRSINETDIGNAAKFKSSFVHNGAIYVFARNFMRYVHDQIGERMDGNEIAAIMTRMGIRDEVLTYHKAERRTTTAARRLPPELFAPEDYASETLV